jgi:membrane protein DedA with SNARE-associated domain
VLSSWHALSAWVQAVLSGMASPAVIALALAAQGAISWPLSLLAVGGGIALGDLGLYALGLGATRIPWLQRRYVGDKSDWARGQIQRRLSTAVLLARVIPGLRLVTYTTSGFVRVPFWPFTAWVLLAVTLWTVGLYALSAAIGHTLSVALALAVPLWRRWRRAPVAFGKTIP